MENVQETGWNEESAKNIKTLPSPYADLMDMQTIREQSSMQIGTSTKI